MASGPKEFENKSDPTEAVKESLTLAIKNLDEKISQRFSSVDQRFDMNDRAVILAREEVKTAARDLAKSQAAALEAALKATTDANIKLERSFETVNGATNEKIDQLRQTINVWTGRDNTEDSNKVDLTSDKGLMLSLLAVLVAAAAFAVTFYRGN